MRAEAVPIVSIRCVSCLESNIFTISRSQHIKLVGRCSDHCEGASYEWTVHDGDNQLIELQPDDTSTGTDSPNLSIRENVLENNQTYKFRLKVRANGLEDYGSATVVLRSSRPPSEGSCNVTLSNTPLVALQDTITVNKSKKHYFKGQKYCMRVLMSSGAL